MIEKEEIKKGYMLPIMETFHTIQGEGYYSGKSAYFIRTAGCDIGCHWCDVKESWDTDNHPVKTIDDIVKEILPLNLETVVITGGEPLIWNLEPLTNLLKKNNLKVNIETSGAYPISGNYDWICVSPKKVKPPIDDLLISANELKVIIYNNDDFKWAEKQACKVNENCVLYLQPEWEKFHQIIPKIVDYIKINPKWNISLQIHKYMNIP